MEILFLFTFFFFFLSLYSPQIHWEAVFFCRRMLVAISRDEYEEKLLGKLNERKRMSYNELHPQM